MVSLYGKMTERMETKPSSYFTKYGQQLPWFAREIWRVAPVVAEKFNLPKNAGTNGVSSFTDMHNAISELRKLYNDFAIWIKAGCGSMDGWSSDFTKLQEYWHQFCADTADTPAAEHGILAINEADPEEKDEDGLERFGAEMDAYKQGNDGWQTTPCPLDDWPAQFKLLKFDSHELRRQLHHEPINLRLEQPVINFNHRQFYLHTRSRRVLEVQGEIRCGRRTQTRTEEHRWIGCLDENKATIEILPFAWELPAHFPKRTPECGGMSRTSSVV
jgi:hypothetical protein